MFRRVIASRNVDAWTVGRAIAIVLAFGVFASACSSSATSPTVVSTVTVTGSAPAVGASSQYTAVATMSDGSMEIVTTTATWSSSNTAIATVSASGLVTAVGEGSASITATFENVSGASQAAVLPAALP